MDALQTPEDQDREAQRQNMTPIEPQHPHQPDEATSPFSKGITTRRDGFVGNSERHWEDVYAGYVIKEAKSGGHFIGPNSECYRVALRIHASRFTKQQALDYIENGCFCKEGGPFVVEDAT